MESDMREFSQKKENEKIVQMTEELIDALTTSYTKHFRGKYIQSSLHSTNGQLSIIDN